MATHTPAQREFIVRKLAEFYTPNEIITQFRANYPDTDCAEPDVTACDPRVVLCGPDEMAMFNATRAAALADLALRWPDALETTRIVLLGLTRQFQALCNRGPAVADLANKTAAEIAKIESGFYSGKGKPEAPSVPGGDKIEAITRTIVDPKNPESV